MSDDGGYAFPGNSEQGMALRDYFAVAAMKAILLKPGVGVLLPSGASDVASNAYKLADAMLEARKR
jgi:hypothetical protein